MFFFENLTGLVGSRFIELSIMIIFSWGKLKSLQIWNMKADSFGFMCWVVFFRISKSEKLQKNVSICFSGLKDFQWYLLPDSIFSENRLVLSFSNVPFLSFLFFFFFKCWEQNKQNVIHLHKGGMSEMDFFKPQQIKPTLSGGFHEAEKICFYDLVFFLWNLRTKPRWSGR